VTDPMLRWGRLAIALGVALMVPPALHAAFHCDEANVFRHITQFGLGDFSAPGRPGLLWLLLTPALGLKEPALVATALRLAAVGASTVTLWAVWRLARRAADPSSALASVLLLATSMSWQAHSFEVRTDTWVLPATLLVMLLLWRGSARWGEAVLIGLLMGAAGLFSQKTIYNAAAIGAGWAALVALRQVPRRWGPPALAAAVALGCVALWYAFLDRANAGVVGENLSLAAANAFEDPRPVRTNLLAWGAAANRAPALYLGLIPGGVVAWRRARENGQLAAMAAAAGVMASTIFFHRGFFMYFIASFEPYLAVVSGAGVVAFLRWLPGGPERRRAAAVGVALLAIGASAGPYVDMLRTSNEAQLQLMRDITEVFPEPVPYWDSVGLLPGYPETTLFLTKSNRLRLRERMGPAALLQLAREREPLVFVRDYITRERYLEEAEDVWLWTHFVPYRPNLYVRGGRVRVRAGQEQRATVEVVDAAPYTVWFWGGWTGEATVGGQPVRHGEAIELERGEVELVARASSGSGQLWLIHGRDRVPYVEDPADVVDRSIYPMLVRRRFQQYDHVHKDGDLLTLETDPVLRALPESERERRRASHRAWQQMFDARMAKVQQGEWSARWEKAGAGAGRGSEEEGDAKE
jgi:hypothetical protein